MLVYLGSSANCILVASKEIPYAYSVPLRWQLVHLGQVLAQKIKFLYIYLYMWAAVASLDVSHSYICTSSGLCTSSASLAFGALRATPLVIHFAIMVMAGMLPPF